MRLSLLEDARPESRLMSSSRCERQPLGDNCWSAAGVTVTSSRPMSRPVGLVGVCTDDLAALSRSPDALLSCSGAREEPAILDWVSYEVGGCSHEDHDIRCAVTYSTQEMQPDIPSRVNCRLCHPDGSLASDQRHLHAQNMSWDRKSRGDSVARPDAKKRMPARSGLAR